MGEFFGTDGIRGLAGEFPLDAPTCQRIGFSLAKHLDAKLGRKPKILIGRDTRESGEWIESCLASGAGAADAEILAAGVITTPGVAYLTRALGADVGVVVSASHNPYRDNGIKVFVSSGGKLDEAMELAIERDIKDAVEFTPCERTLGMDPQLKHQYLAFLQNEIAQGLDLSQLSIVVDCANGACFELAPQLFTALGAQVHAIHAQPNGTNINLHCGALHPQALQQAVLERKADLGFAFDGDADRLVLVDENGRLVDGDHVLYIMANWLSGQGKLKGNRVVATVMSNIGLEVALAEKGITLVRTPVGDKYVLQELLANGGSVGGEQSGHVIFPEISLAGDGMITALEVLRAMQDSKRSLGELKNGFKTYPQIIVNVPVSSKPPFHTIPPLQQAIVAVEEHMGKRGRLVLRYSGTENLARVMLEGPDEDQIRRHADDLASLIAQHIG